MSLASHHGPWCDEPGQPSCETCFEDNLTKRQKFWYDAAVRADAEGNPIAATLFALLTEPNREERK